MMWKEGKRRVTEFWRPQILSFPCEPLWTVLLERISVLPPGAHPRVGTKSRVYFLKAKKWTWLNPYAIGSMFDDDISIYITYEHEWLIFECDQCQCNTRTLVPWVTKGFMSLAQKPVISRVKKSQWNPFIFDHSKRGYPCNNSAF